MNDNFKRNIFEGTIKAGGDVIGGDKIETGDITESVGVQIGSQRSVNELGPLTKTLMALINADFLVVATHPLDEEVKAIEPVTVAYEGSVYILISLGLWNKVKAFVEFDNSTCQAVLDDSLEFKVIYDRNEVAKIYRTWVLRQGRV